jgi:hypothetical protein
MTSIDTLYTDSPIVKALAKCIEVRRNYWPTLLYEVYVEVVRACRFVWWKLANNSVNFIERERFL